MRSGMPKRSRSGRVIRPERVVAPTRVKGGSSMRTERAAGPSPRLARLAAPAGLLTAMVLHGTWNAAADLGTDGFLVVYGVLMVPCFVALVCFALWARSRAARHAWRRGRRSARR